MRGATDGRQSRGIPRPVGAELAAAASFRETTTMPEHVHAQLSRHLPIRKDWLAATQEPLSQLIANPQPGQGRPPPPGGSAGITYDYSGNTMCHSE